MPIKKSNQICMNDDKNTKNKKNIELASFTCPTSPDDNKGVNVVSQFVTTDISGRQNPPDPWSSQGSYPRGCGDWENYSCFQSLYCIYGQQVSQYDWWYTNDSCESNLSQQKLCVVGPFACPVIQGTADIVRTKFADNSQAEISDSEGRLMECYYKDFYFDTAEKVDAWINFFKPFGNTGNPGVQNNLDVYNNVIMPYFCGLPADADTCETYPFDPPLNPCNPTGGTGCTGYMCPNVGPGCTGSICKNGLTGCSRFGSTKRDGDLCRAWDKAVGAKKASPVFEGFCAKNTCAQDCLCYNRKTVDFVFTAVTSSQGWGVPPESDACWYEPCKNDQYLIDVSLIGAVCSATICEQVVEVIGNTGTNVNIPQAQEEISCNISQNQTFEQELTGFLSRYWIWVVVIGCIILVLIVIIVIFAVIGHNKSKQTVSVPVDKNAATKPATNVNTPNNPTK